MLPFQNRARIWAHTYNLKAVQDWLSHDPNLSKPPSHSKYMVCFAARAAWTDVLDMLWNAALLTPNVFLSTAWQDLKNGPWSTVATEHRTAAEDWLIAKTWGTVESFEHQKAQRQAQAHALRSALARHLPDVWAHALRQGVKVNNAAGHRLVETLLPKVLKETGHASKSWHTSALNDLLDHHVSLSPSDLVKVFHNGSDELLNRCLAVIRPWSDAQRSLALAQAGLLGLQQVNHGGKEERREHFFQALFSMGLTPRITYTQKTLACSHDFTQGGHLRTEVFFEEDLMTVSSTLPVVTIAPEAGRQTLFVADHWWSNELHWLSAENRAQRCSENRHRLTSMIETPKLIAALQDVAVIAPVQRRRL